MNPCEIYECFGEILGVPLPQLAQMIAAGCFAVAIVLIGIFRNVR